MAVGIATKDPTTGGDACIGVISTHCADIGFGSRIRIGFTPGETDNGLPLGRSVHADNAGGVAAGTRDSAHVAGAFGTITFGDTAGAAKQAAGQAGCAGITGLDA